MLRCRFKDGYLKEKDTFILTRHKSALYVIEIAGLSIEALAWHPTTMAREGQQYGNKYVYKVSMVVD